MDKKDLPKGWGDSSDEDYIFSSFPVMTMKMKNLHGEL